MENLILTVIFLFTLFFLLGSGVWIGLSLMGVAYVGLELFTNRPAGDAMITTIWSSASSWSLTALPLFIWMGEILYRTRLSKELKEKMVSHFSADQLRINDLEKFFTWDRKNGMKYIYKILDLMDRNYLIDQNIDGPFVQYSNQYKKNCSTID